MTQPDAGLLGADWPDCPEGVGWAVTTRVGGVSTGPYASFNLGAHVGDAPDAVADNRQRLRERLALPAEPVWLNQVHGTRVVSGASLEAGAEADAAYTRSAGRPLGILTADCLAVLMVSADGSEIGTAHAGWRSLAGGILTGLLSAFECPPEQVRVFFGPAIGPSRFEVGPEVRAAMLALSGVSSSRFRPGQGDRWLADLPGVAGDVLAACGVQSFAGGHWCTLSDEERFFSYRRSGRTGRMASLVWRK